MLRGYTANLAICDEAAFMPEQVITEIIYPMLSTTKGTIILLSTPWGHNHFFYRAYTNPQYTVHTVKSNQNPLITSAFLTEMQQNMTKEAYKREYEAEFTEAATSYFPQDLIRNCVTQAQNQNLELTTTLEQPIPQANYYAGLDLGKLQANSALAIVKHENTQIQLIYLYQFPTNTPYTQVIGHLNHTHQKYQLQKTLIDQTGVGEPILEEIHNQNITTAQGVKFTTETKKELLTTLKLSMEQNRLAIPYHRQLCQQINEQQYTYTKTGQLQFHHPPNTNDDMLWALALAVTATKTEPPPKLYIIPRTLNKPRLQQLRQKPRKHQLAGNTR